MDIIRIGATASVGVLMLCAQAEASVVYGLDIRNDEFYTTTTDGFLLNFTVIGGVSYEALAMDTDVPGTTLYAVLFDGLNTVGTIDLTTGAFTPSIPEIVATSTNTNFGVYGNCDARCARRDLQLMGLGVYARQILRGFARPNRATVLNPHSARRGFSA